MGFKHRIPFATNLAANFGCNRIRIMPDIVSKLLRATIWSRCAVRFESEQTPFPRNRLLCFAQECTGVDSKHVVLFLCHIFTQRPITGRKMEQSDGRGFGRLQLLANSIEIFILYGTESASSPSSRPEIYKALKPCWLSKWVSISREVARFSQASRSRPAATAADSETPCVYARPSDPRKLCRSAAPTWPPSARHLILLSKPSIVLWNSLRAWLPDDLQELEFGLKLEHCRLTNGL